MPIPQGLKEPTSGLASDMAGLPTYLGTPEACMVKNSLVAVKTHLLQFYPRRHDTRNLDLFQKLGCKAAARSSSRSRLLLSSHDLRTPFSSATISRHDHGRFQNDWLKSTNRDGA